MKNNKTTILIVGITVVLAGVALFTAMRLYQLRQESVVPSVPESEPAASETTPPSMCSLTFTLTLGTASPSPTTSSTPTATPSLSPTPTATPTQPPIGGLPSPTPTPTRTPTPTATAFSTPSATPSGTSSLPAAGSITPTLVGIGMGLVLLIGAFILAI